VATIGVFDSGIGGLSVVKAIEKALPNHTVVFRNDTENMPYGNKRPDELVQLVNPILRRLVDDGCEVIVIACNTVTTNIIDVLRAQFAVPLIGIEPMIKPAAIKTKTGTIAVCATPMTLASTRYAYLKQQYAQGITVLEPDCSDWSLMIESNHVDQQKIRSTTEGVIRSGADVIVLGCTHYHWIEENILACTNGKARVLQPESAVITQLKRVLSKA
jgi:glutamate racemase